MAFGIITVHHILNDNFEFDKRYINFVVCDNWDKNYFWTPVRIAKEGS